MQIKFHLYKVKMGSLESYAIGDVNTILRSLDGKETEKTEYELFTIDSDGKERGCFEGTSFATRRYLTVVVLYIEKIIEEKSRKLKKITEVIFGTDSEEKEKVS